MASCETLSTWPVQEAVAGEIEGIDLDLGFLPGLHKADVAVRHHGLDFEPAVARHDHQQGLRRRDDAADRVDRELLHHAVDRGGQLLQPGLLLGLDQVLGQPVRLLLGLGELVGQACGDIRPRPGARVSRIAATAASASRRWLFWTPSSSCCSTRSWSVSK